MDYRYGSHTVFQIEYHLIERYLEHHFEPWANDDFKMEPE